MTRRTESTSAEDHASERIADRRKRLPPGWEWTTVEAMGDVTLGRQRSPKDHDGPDMRPYLRVANVYEDRIDLTDVKSMNFSPEEFTRFQLQEGDILLNEGQSKELVGRAAIYRGEVPNACFQNTLIRFRCSPVLRPTYALTIFRCYLHTGEFRRVAQWTTNIAHLGAQRFAEMDFPLAPMAEQDRIVEAIESYLSRLSDAVATLERVERNLKRYRASVLKAAVEGRLVPTEAALAKQEGRDYEHASGWLDRILAERRRRWGASGKKGKYEEPEPPDSRNLPVLPEGWCWATWEQLSARVTVGHVGKMVDEYVPSGIPFLRSQNVRPNYFDPSGLKFITEEFHQRLVKSSLEPGDLLIVRSGSVGVACAVPSSLPVANCSDLVIVKQVVGVDPRFGAYYMNSMAKSTVRKEQVGIALTHFNTQSAAALPIPVPPMAEQRRIVAEADRLLSVIDEIEAQVASDLGRCRRLRQSILKWAFEGKLADQDPNDEPASALLERIKAERDTPKPAKKTKRA